MSYTTHKQRKIGKMVLTTLVIFALVVIAIMVAGCSTPAAPSADPKASQAAAPAPVEETEEPEVVVSGNYSFGDVVTFEDNLSLSVSAPAPYTPSEYAAGVVEGQQVLLFEFVLTNNTGENFDPTLVYATASSGGVEAGSVFDTGEGIDFNPTTAILPGQTVKWKQAWSVADPAAITMEISVGFEYDDIIFTNIQ